MAAGSPHVSIVAETLFNIGGIPVTNSMVTSLLPSAILILFAIAFASSYDPNAKRPKGLQNFAEWLIEALYNLVYSVTGSTKKAVQFFPFIASFFLFIVLNNWVGLLPGVGTIGYTHEAESVEEHANVSVMPQAYAAETTAQVDDHGEEVNEILPADGEEVLELHTEDGALEAEGEHVEAEEEHHTVFTPYFRAGTADLNMTIALALISQVLAQYFGFSHLGLGYLKKFFNFSSPIMFFVGILEFMGEFTKIISFAFRLFGNIFAGEVLLAVIAFLVPVVVPMPFYGLELFVGMIQGLVFAMLSVVFFNMATMGHGDEH